MRHYLIHKDHYLIDIVVGFGAGLQEGDALGVSQVLPSAGGDGPLRLPVTLVPDQQSLHVS